MKDTRRVYIDALTGVYNRTFLDEKIEGILEKAREEGRIFQLAIFDVDYFKRINDFYGHRVGDEVLKEFADFLKSSLRAGDLIARYGGDEFVVLLYDVEYTEAIRIVERILAKCREREFGKIQLTASVGLASFPAHGDRWESLFELADRSLYMAKRQGRDRVGVLEKMKNLIIPPTDLIGRIDEVSKILYFLKNLGDGNGAVVFVKGEIGVGKTRLIKEVLGYPQISGFKKIEVALSPVTQSIVLYPLREILKSLFSEDGKFATLLSPYLKTEISKLYPIPGEVYEEEPSYYVDKFRLFNAVEEIFKIATQNSPILLFIDNIQWADSYFLDIIHYLIKSEVRRNVAIIFAARVEELRGAQLISVLKNIAMEASFLEIELSPLTKDDVRQLLMNVLGQNVPDYFLNFIFSKGGGNPYILCELVKSLIGSGDVYWAEGKWEFNTEIGFRVPETIEAILDMKISALDQESINILETVSVFGRPFKIELLEHISGLSVNQVEPALEGLVELGFLSKDPNGTHYFQEEILRDAIYKRIDDEKKKGLHLRVAEVLKERQPENLEEIAQHFYFACDFNNAYDFLIKAADKAKNLYANNDAIRFYTWAIDSLHKSQNIEDKELKESDILVKRGDIYQLIGESEKALLDYERAQRLAQTAGDRIREAYATYYVGNVLNSMGRNFDANEKMENAYRIFEQMRDVDGMALCYLGIGLNYHDLGKNRIALSYLEKAVDLACKAKRQDLVAKVLRNIGNVYFETERYEEALKYYKESYEMLERIYKTQADPRVLANIGNVYFILGNVKQSIELYERALEIAQKTGDLWLQGVIYYNLGVTFFLKLGDAQKAKSFIEKSVNLLHLVGDLSNEINAVNSLAVLYRNLGVPERAIELNQRTVKMARQLKNKVLEITCTINLSNVFLQFGYLKKALAGFKRSLRMAKEAGLNRLQAMALNNLGAVYYMIGDFREAESCALKSIESLRNVNIPEEYIDVYLTLTKVYIELGDMEKAESALAEAEMVIKRCNNNLTKLDFKLVAVELQLAKGESILERRVNSILSESRSMSVATRVADSLVLAGRVKAASGSIEEAEAHFKEAISILIKQKDRFYLAKTYFEYANCLKQWRKQRESMQLYQKAISIFTKIGSLWWAERVKSFLP